jgi:hypothetical protein
MNQIDIYSHDVDGISQKSDEISDSRTILSITVDIVK